MSVRTVILAFASTVLCCGSVLQAQQNDSLHASVIPDAEASYANSPVDAMPVIGNEISTDPGGAPSPQGGKGQVRQHQFHPPATTNGISM